MGADRELRRLGPDEVAAAARQYRRAAAMIPGHDPAQQPEAATVAAYAQAFERAAFWGAFERDALLGHLVLAPGWIEQLYVEPGRHGEGIGRTLLALAQAEQDELRLHAYQVNARARRFYEAAGFVAEAFGIDGGHVDLAPTVTYRWRRLTGGAASP